MQKLCEEVRMVVIHRGLSRSICQHKVHVLEKLCLILHIGAYLLLNYNVLIIILYLFVKKLVSAGIVPNDPSKTAFLKVNECTYIIL